MNKGLDWSQLSGRVDHYQLTSWLVKEMSISRTYLISCLGIKSVCFPTLLTVKDLRSLIQRQMSMLLKKSKTK